MIRLMLRPAGLFAIALMAMFAVLGVKLWREGVFDAFRISHAATVQTGGKSWMLGDRLTPPRTEKVTEAGQAEPKQAGPAEAVSDDADPEGDAAE